MNKNALANMRRKIAFIAGEKKAKRGVYKLTAECRLDDPSKYEKLPTGITSVDNMLHGGIPRGVSYTVISGAAGEGKSTLVSQIQARTISNTDYTCITYSGEMSDGLVKWQLYRQLAGDAGMIDGAQLVPPRFGDYMMRDGVAHDIETVTRYQSILFDPTGGDLHVQDPWGVWQASMEQSAAAGIEVFIVDNLMTIVAALTRSMPRLSDYERQREFCDWAARFVKKYNVWLILVAHTRKPGQGQGSGASAYEISGASEIVNLAGTIINYGKYSDRELEDNPELRPSDRKSKVQKNRLYGDYDNKGTTVHFDPMTCRIGSKLSDLDDCNYPWREKFKDPDYLALVTDEIDPVTGMTLAEIQKKVDDVLIPAYEAGNDNVRGEIDQLFATVERLEKGE